MRSKPAAIQALVSLFIFQPIIGNLFGPPKHKLAFASTRNSPSSIKDASPQDDLPVVDTPELRKSVQRIYETWMQRRREDMLAQLKEGMLSIFTLNYSPMT
uniref:Uncharacterized protein n=1 Tax=Panagrellus redivivus TaxID=6233 RepID=A0A7E4UR49_PANRE